MTWLSIPGASVSTLQEPILSMFFNKRMPIITNRSDTFRAVFVPRLQSWCLSSTGIFWLCPVTEVNRRKYGFSKSHRNNGEIRITRDNDEFGKALEFDIPDIERKPGGDLHEWNPKTHRSSCSGFLFSCCRPA